MKNDYSYDFLSHHGVQGMKWGVRNGPPYPLYRQDPVKYKAIKRLQNAAKTKKKRRQYCVVA